MELEEEFEMRSRAELETRSRDPAFDNLDGEGRHVSVSVLVVWTQPCKTLISETLFQIGPAEDRRFTRLVEFHFLCVLNVCAKFSVDTTP